MLITPSIAKAGVRVNAAIFLFCCPLRRGNMRKYNHRVASDYSLLCWKSSILYPSIWILPVFLTQLTLNVVQDYELMAIIHAQPTLEFCNFLQSLLICTIATSSTWTSLVNMYFMNFM